jgi:hypothetical protein
LKAESAAWALPGSLAAVLLDEYDDAKTGGHVLPSNDSKLGERRANNVRRGAAKQMIQPEQSPAPGEPIVGPTATVRPRLPAWIRCPLRWTGKASVLVLQALLIAWSVLALYYSNLPWPGGRLILAMALGIFAIWALWVVRQSGRPRWRWSFAGAFLGVVVWHACIPPSNDRPWRAEVERPALAVIDGDRVRFINYRNFRYRSRDDFDVRYEEREVDVSRLASVDLFISYWKVGPVAHTFLSFNFDDGSPPVCISIEARPEIGEAFAPLA